MFGFGKKCEHRFTESKDGVNIFCEKCGEFKEIPCNHVYEVIDTLKMETKARYQYCYIHISTIYVSRCTECGVIKHDSVGVGDA